MNAQRWIFKFKNSFRGFHYGMKGEDSFFVHVPVAITVVFVAWLLRCDLTEHCILLLCIGIVMVAELANSAVERLAKALSPEFNKEIGIALDIASSAVLVASLFAAIVGVLIFGHRIF